MELNTNAQPTFTHDCESCIFVGSYRSDALRLSGILFVDLWYHPNNDKPRLTSLIARHGSEPHEYASSLAGLVGDGRYPEQWANVLYNEITESEKTND